MNEQFEHMGGVGVWEWLRNYIGGYGYGKRVDGWIIFRVDDGWIQIPEKALDDLKAAMNKVIDDVNNATVNTWDGLVVPSKEMIDAGRNK